MIQWNSLYPTLPSDDSDMEPIRSDDADNGANGGCNTEQRCGNGSTTEGTTSGEKEGSRQGVCSDMEEQCYTGNAWPNCKSESIAGAA